MIRWKQQETGEGEFEANFSAMRTAIPYVSTPMETAPTGWRALNAVWRRSTTCRTL